MFSSFLFYLNFLSSSISLFFILSNCLPLPLSLDFLFLLSNYLPFFLLFSVFIPLPSHFPLLIHSSLSPPPSPPIFIILRLFLSSSPSSSFFVLPFNFVHYVILSVLFLVFVFLHFLGPHWSVFLSLLNFLVSIHLFFLSPFSVCLDSFFLHSCLYFLRFCLCSLHFFLLLYSLFLPFPSNKIFFSFSSLRLVQARCLASPLPFYFRSFVLILLFPLTSPLLPPPLLLFLPFSSKFFSPFLRPAGCLASPFPLYFRYLGTGSLVLGLPDAWVSPLPTGASGPATVGR